MSNLVKDEYREDIDLDTLTSMMDSSKITCSSELASLLTPKYDILNELSVTPNSTVYMVKSKKFGTQGDSGMSSKNCGGPIVAKVVTGRTFCTLLEKEFATLTTLDHPGIVKPIEFLADYENFDKSVASM